MLAFLREAEELAVQIAHKEISIDQYAETVERLKEEVPRDRIIEVEVVFQLAGFKMEQESIQNSEEIRNCYRLAARMTREVLEKIREEPLDRAQGKFK